MPKSRWLRQLSILQAKPSAYDYVLDQQQEVRVLPQQVVAPGLTNIYCFWQLVKIQFGLMAKSHGGQSSSQESQWSESLKQSSFSSAPQSSIYWGNPSRRNVTATGWELSTCLGSNYNCRGPTTPLLKDSCCTITRQSYSWISRAPDTYYILTALPACLL